MFGGKVDNIEFFMMCGIIGGYWQIDLMFEFFNGKWFDVYEYYEFDSGFGVNEVCCNMVEVYFCVV